MSKRRNPVETFGQSKSFLESHVPITKLFSAETDKKKTKKPYLKARYVRHKKCSGSPIYF